MNYIEKEIVICGKKFTLKTLNLCDGKFNMKYECTELPFIEMYIDEKFENSKYSFIFRGDVFPGGKTDVEALNRVLGDFKKRMNSKLEDAKYEVSACKNKVKEANERFHLYSQYMTTLEEIFKECKEQMSIKDIIE